MTINNCEWKHIKADIQHFGCSSGKKKSCIRNVTMTATQKVREMKIKTMRSKRQTKQQQNERKWEIMRENWERLCMDMSWEEKKTAANIHQHNTTESAKEWKSKAKTEKKTTRKKNNEKKDDKAMTDIEIKHQGIVEKGALYSSSKPTVYSTALLSCCFLLLLKIIQTRTNQFHLAWAQIFCSVYNVITKWEEWDR